MEQLTQKQTDILEFIRDEIDLKKRPPSVREIGEHFNLASTNGVSQHLDALERKGYIRRSRKISRGIELLHYMPWALPVMGTIAAGAPIEAIEDVQEINLEDMVLHKDCYLLRVRGTSMIDDNIQEGDYVIVERRPTAQNGDIVVAILENNEATLKRFYREDGRIRLQPANSEMEPIYPEQLEIRGVVLGVLRKY